MSIKNWLDYRPSGFNCFLAREERAVTGHGVAQQPLVRRFLAWLLFDQVEFSLVADGLRERAGISVEAPEALREDEIVLFDCGPDLRHYSSDIARLWPVNGVFSPWHRRVYGFIVE